MTLFFFAVSICWTDLLVWMGLPKVNLFFFFHTVMQAFLKYNANIMARFLPGKIFDRSVSYAATSPGSFG